MRFYGRDHPRVRLLKWFVPGRNGWERETALCARTRDVVPLPLSRGAQRLFYGCRVVAPSLFVLRENRTGKRKKHMAAVETVRGERRAASLAPPTA